MPVTPEVKNPTVLARDFREKITARTGLKDFDVDSKTDVLVTTFVNQLVTSRNESISAFHANHISTAKKVQLDRIGDEIGRRRRAATFGNVSSSDQNLAFYVASGTFGDINGGGDITIPVGTRIFSEADDNELGAVVEYKTTKEAVLSSTGTLRFVAARCVASGHLGNVGASVLRNHAFTNYASGTGLLVANFYPVLNARPQEKDESYRFRLSRHYDTLNTTNSTKLQLSALGVAGVLDTRIISGYYGIGTVGVVVLAAENQASATLVTAVQARLSRMAGPGMRLIAVPATSVFFDLELSVKPLRALTLSEKRRVEATMRRGLRNYFRSLSIGGSISLSDAAGELRNYLKDQIRLASLGKASDIFTTVYVRRGPSSGTSTERDLLEATGYALDSEEYADLGTLAVTYL